MERIYLNCTNDIYCQIIKKEYATLFLPYLMIIMSLLGIIFNSTSAFILIFSKNSSTKFLKFLKIYSFNSLAISLNDFVYNIFYLSSMSKVYISSKKGFVETKNIFKFFVIYLNVLAFLYTFSGIIDIFIVYERIQIYVSSVKFLRNKTAGMISFGVLIYSVLINVPISLSRMVYHERISINSNEPINLYLYGVREFHYQKIFLISIFICNFTRDLISFIMEIVMNVILIITMIRYYKRKTSNNVQNPNTFAFKRTDVNNSKIALFMNFLSALSHISIFSLFILIRFLSFSVFRILSQIIGIVQWKNYTKFLVLIRINTY